MTYKGCQKKMILLKNTGSDLFDEAYFILSDKAATEKKLKESDMITEANRIIGQSLTAPLCSVKKLKPHGRAASLVIYFSGVLTGVLASIAIILLGK